MSNIDFLRLANLLVGISCLALFVFVLLRVKGWKSPVKWVAIAIAVAYSIMHGLIFDNWGEGTLLVLRGGTLCALCAVCYFATHGRDLSGRVRG